MLLRIKHKLTAYHWRSNHSDKPYKVAICECGWRDDLFRKVRRTQKIRFFTKGCFIRGCNLDEPQEMLVGPADGPDEEFTSMGTMTQCDRCYKTKVS